MTKTSQSGFARNEFRLMCEAKDYIDIDFTHKNWANDFISNLIEIIQMEELTERWEVDWELLESKLRPMTEFDLHQLIAELDFFQDKDDEDYRTFFHTLPTLRKIFLMAEKKGVDFEFILKGKKP